MPLHPNTIEFYESDWQGALFPLESTRILLRNGQNAFGELIYEQVLAQEDPPNFQQQVRAYADKSGGHLRRTMKLDPVAEVFLYDLVYRNRTSLPRDAIAGRRAFGFRFRERNVISSGAAYRHFRSAVRDASLDFEFSLECDISAYFNSIYHHDIEHFYRDHWSSTDVDHLGLFLRQVNGGRSVDCMPQGIMPAKILGHHFLRFLDYSGELQSDRILRFMDDIVLFSDSQQVLQQDFVTIQHLLGERALNINPRKTSVGHARQIHGGRDMDDIRRQLLARRRDRVGGYDDDDDNNGADSDSEELTDAQLHYLNDLLSQDDIEEPDAELVLDLMRDHSESVMGHVSMFLEAFPNLCRSIHRFVGGVDDRTELGNILSTFIADHPRLSEYQLFWMAVIARDYLVGTTQYGTILHSLYAHPTATTVSKAAVLEIPEVRWGFPDLRRTHLRSGQSDWCAWAAAVGSREDNRAQRNHLLTYFANSGPINQLVAHVVQRI